MNIVLMETAKRFLDSLPKKHQNKVYYNLNVVSAGSKDSRLFKKLEGHDIWELTESSRPWVSRLHSEIEMIMILGKNNAFGAWLRFKTRGGIAG